MKTLKREEIYANQYDNLEHLRANIESFSAMATSRRSRLGSSSSRKERPHE